MALKVYRIAVIGTPRSVLDPTKLEIGVGKSCFCCRFIKPEAYAEEHPFAISDEQWKGPTINRDHFLYWGAVSRTLPGLHQRARFQVIEQTEFVNGSSYHPYPSSHGYITRAVDSPVESEGKIAYKSQSRRYHPSPPAVYGRTTSLNSFQSSTQIFPSDDFQDNGMAGYVCIFDPTVPAETGAMQRQLDFLAAILKALNKARKRYIVACTKCDAAKEDDIRMGQNLAMTIKKNTSFIECSARENVNICEVFYSFAINSKRKYFSRSQLSVACLPYRDASNSKKREKNQVVNTYKTLLWKKVKSFETTWENAQMDLQNELEFPLIMEVVGVDLMKKLFCLRLMELKVEEASKKFGGSSAPSTQRSTSFKDKVQNKKYQEFLSDAFADHPDLGDNALQNYARSTSSISESMCSFQGDSLGPLPPTPDALDKNDTCFSDLDSRYDSEDLIEDHETADELEDSQSSPQLDKVHETVTVEVDSKLLKSPRSFSAQVEQSESFKYVVSKGFKSSGTLSLSEEQLWERTKSLPRARVKHRFSSDAILADDRPPLPPRTNSNFLTSDVKKIASKSKPLPPLPIDEEEFIPNFESQKLSSSLDCLRSPTFEEASPYLAPVDIPGFIKRDRNSFKFSGSSSRIAEKPPLPEIPAEFPNRNSVGIVRSKTQYNPARKYGHKRSRSTNCEFLKSLTKEDKPQQKDNHNLTISSYATLRPSAPMAYNMRNSVGSPTESDLDSSLMKKNAIYRKVRGSKQSLVPDDTDQESFGFYQRMSPAPQRRSPVSLDRRSPLASSCTDVSERASSVPPKRGEKRRARRWKSKDKSMHGPKYVTQFRVPHSKSGSISPRISVTIHSNRSSRDSNIYEHVDEEILEDLRKNYSDDYQTSSEPAPPIYHLKPGTFPRPPTAQEWHYFMHMWQMFLDWMKERAPSDVYNVPSNIPADVTYNIPPPTHHTIPQQQQQRSNAEVDRHKDSVTSYTSINADWIKEIASHRLPDEGVRSNSIYSPILEDTASLKSHPDHGSNNEIRSQSGSLPRNVKATASLNANGKSVCSVDSGIYHAISDDINPSTDT